MGNEKMSKEEIARKKKERAAAKRLMIDKLRFWVGVFSVPTILIMACMLIGAAYYLGESQLAVVTGLITNCAIRSPFFISNAHLLLFFKITLISPL